MKRAKVKKMTYLTARQAAERWNLSLNGVREMCVKGEITAVKLGNVWRIPLELNEGRWFK